MTGNEAKILLDLNYPAFQSALFELDMTELKKVVRTLRKLQAMSWNELFRDHGLKWEELKSVSGKYTIRLSLSYRAVVLRQGAWMRFEALHVDHDGAYGKK
jgi:mRNA-degrading endonuclease YafQ of YafQ-DinJ toxin-antitoxin module